MKRAVLILLAVLVVVVAGAVFAVSRIDPETLRTKVADMTREATGKPLYMAQAPKISLMPLGVSFGEVSWGLVDGKASPDGISVAVKSGTLSVDFWPLLSGRVVAHEVRLDSPQVTIRPMPKADAQEEKKAAEANPEAEKMRSLPLELARLNITNGSFLLEAVPGESVRVHSFNASIANLKPGAEATVKLDMGLELQKPAVTGNISLAGHIRQDGDVILLRQTKLSLTPLKGAIPATLGTVQIALNGAWSLGEQLLDLEGIKISLAGLSMEASGKGQVGAGEFAGRMQLTAEPGLVGKNLGLALPSFPGSGKTTLGFALTATKDKCSLKDIKADLDGMPLNGALTLGLGTLPSLEGSLALGSVNLTPLLAGDKTARQGEAGAAAPPRAKAQASNAKASGATLPRLDLEIRVAEIKAMNTALKDMQVRVKGAGGQTTRYTVDPLQWTYASGGSQNVVVQIEMPSLRCSINGKLHNLAAGPLLQALNGSRPVEAAVFCEYNLTLNATSAATIKQTLSGRGTLWAQNIVLNNVSVLPKGAPVPGTLPTHFSRLNIPFTAQNGVVNIANMTLTGTGLNAQGKGTVRLPQEDVNMAATVSTLNLNVPVTVSGPFSNLAYGVDPKWAKQVLLGLPGAVLEGGKQGGSIVKGAGSSVGGAGEKVGGAIKGLLGR